MKTLSLSLLATAVAFGVGCQKSPEQKAQELSDTRQQAAENVDQARREAAEKTAKVNNEADEKVAKEQAKVDQKASEVTVSLDRARADVRKEVEEKLGKVDKRIVDLHTKIATAKSTKAPRQDLEESLRGLQSKSASVHKDVNAIDNANESSLDGVKTNIQAEIAQIEQSLDELERKV